MKDLGMRVGVSAQTVAHYEMLDRNGRIGDVSLVRGRAALRLGNAIRKAFEFCTFRFTNDGRGVTYEEGVMQACAKLPFRAK